MLITKQRKPIAVLTALVFMLTIVLGGVLPAAAQTGDSVSRVAGETRFDTAVEIAKDAFPNGADTVIIANSKVYADAINASLLASYLDAPILLAEPDKLPSATNLAVAPNGELGVENVYIVGGTEAVSEDVENYLKNNHGLNVERIEGETRNHTAASIAQYATADFGFIAAWDDDANALAAGAVAYSDKAPILLVQAGMGVPGVTQQAIKDLELSTLYVLGNDITDDQVAALEAIDGVETVERLADDVAIANKFFGDATSAVVANGTFVVDALGGSVYAQPILYVESDSIPADVAEFLDGKTSVKVLGGTSAVSETVESDIEDVIEGTTELEVISVSAINANYVIVAITAPEEDMLEQTVEVKNSTDEIVEVKPLDIAAGDETAEFEFVTPVDAEDLVGVWTVNGVEYDLDLYNNLKAFLDANDQIALNKALTDLGIENVDIANMPDYFTEQQKLAGTVEPEELTVEDVQKLVDDVNAEAISSEEEEALVEAIVNAVTAGNQITTLQALEDAGIAPLNSEWIEQYMAGTATNGGLDDITTANDLDDVQAVINALNDELVANNITTTGIDRDALTDSIALIEAYATVDEDGNYVTAQFDTDIEDINIQLALIDVLEATTPTAFKNKLTALADLIDDTSVLDMDDYVDANGKAYIDALEAADDADKDTVDEVEGILFSYDTDSGDLADSVNKQESDALIAAVTSAADADALLDALNELGVKQVADTNVDSYFAYDVDSTEGADYTAITTKAEAQALVDAVNVSEVQNATESTIIEKLNVFGIDNVVAANAEAYAASAADDSTPGAIYSMSAGADNDATVEAVKNAVDAVNKQVIIDTQVDAINEAEDVVTVKDALDALADVNEAAGYLMVRSVDREFVAAYVLENRPEAGYADESAVQDIIGSSSTDTNTALEAYDVALTTINGITLTSNPVEIVTALELMLDEDFNELTNTEKSDVAEAFYDQLTFKDDGTLETPFVTLAAVKDLLN